METDGQGIENKKLSVLPRVMVATEKMKIVMEKQTDSLNLISNKRASRRATHVGGGLVLGIQSRTAP